MCNSCGFISLLISVLCCTVSLIIDKTHRTFGGNSLGNQLITLAAFPSSNCGYKFIIEYSSTYVLVYVSHSVCINTY